MKSNIKHILFMTSFTMLSACTPYTESFDCPPGRGVGCQSLSTVNQMVEDGKLPLEDDSTDRKKEPLTSQDPLMIEARALLMSDDIKSHPTGHIKVWLAGYEDSHGSDRFYHAPSFVYVAK